jgi:deoxynucleotidyltransferase terminal-interacting protein 1
VYFVQYSGDQDDKVWLHEHKLMPATGGKAYMLMVEDIVDLSKTDEYK